MKYEDCSVFMLKTKRSPTTKDSAQKIVCLALVLEPNDFSNLLGPRVSLPHRLVIRDTTIRGPRVDITGAPLRRGIDADIDEAIQSALDAIAELSDLNDRVITTTLTLLEELVLAVERQGLLVRVVWSCLLNGREEGLIKVELADMGDGAALDGVVGQLGCAVMDDGVQMIWTSSIMARNNGLEASSAVGACRLDTAERRVLDLLRSSQPCTICFGDHTSVYTSGIASPQLNIYIWDRLACGHVDHVDVKVKIDSLATLTNISPDELTSNPVRAFSNFRVGNTLGSLPFLKLHGVST